MTRRRWLGLAVATGGTLALAAPAAQAAQDTPLTFAAGTVEVQDLGVTSNTVRFTMRAPNPNTARLFIDTYGTGRACIALRQPDRARGRACGLQQRVDRHVPGVHRHHLRRGRRGAHDRRLGRLRHSQGRARPGHLPDGGGQRRRRSRLQGFDGVSAGRPLTFATAVQTLTTALDWQAPGEATGLRAVGTPHAITLFWNPPAHSLGVRYQLIETLPDGSEAIVSESVAGRGDGLQPHARQRAHLPPVGVPLLGRAASRDTPSGNRTRDLRLERAAS